MLPMLPSESCSNALIKNCSKIKNRNVKKQISEKAVFFIQLHQVSDWGPPWHSCFGIPKAMLHSKLLIKLVHVASHNITFTYAHILHGNIDLTLLNTLLGYYKIVLCIQLTSVGYTCNTYFVIHWSTIHI